MRMLRVVGTLIVAAAVLMTFSLPARAEPKESKDQPKEQAKPKLRFGGDFRLREELFDDIPVRSGGTTRSGRNDYYRFRTRLWTEWDVLENLTLRARIVNEIRNWVEPDGFRAANPESSTYEFPDEWVLDNLYVEVRDLFNKKLDLRIGRQDLIYGRGMLMLEGTPKDGSRTLYFNAAKATWKGIRDTTVDVFGLYNPAEDQWAINSSDRDLTGQSKGFNNMDDSGGGIYVKNKTLKDLPYDLYYIYKNESSWTKGSGTSAVDVAAADLHTVGLRLTPQFTKAFSGSFELAYQLGERGDRDIEGYGGDGSLVYVLPFAEDAKPTADIGFYYLSGDDPGTAGKDEGWNPLWARFPQYSEMYFYAWDAEGAGRWSNLMMPHVGVSVSPVKWLKLSGMIADLYAVEDDGPGDGKHRGLLYVAKGEFTFGEKIWLPKDKLTGHLWLEILEPGDYYIVDDPALFVRWQFMYEF